MKNDFIKHELFILTIMGAFQHNKIYSDNVSEASKIKFRKNLELLLNRITGVYKQKVSENDHLYYLDQLKSLIEAAHKDILLGGLISFGTVQKILNLYLKYLWSINLVVEPPHCPIDSIILSRLYDRSTRWTTMEKKAYISIIEKINQIKKNKSIAEWELTEFNRR
jgi:hypothetical protein